MDWSRAPVHKPVPPNPGGGPTQVRGSYQRPVARVKSLLRKFHSRVWGPDIGLVRNRARGSGSSGLQGASGLPSLSRHKGRALVCSGVATQSVGVAYASPRSSAS